MDKPPTNRNIDVLIFEGVNLLDIAGPVQAFEAARHHDRRVYAHRYVSFDGGPVRASNGLLLQADSALADRVPGRDFLVPGGDGVDAALRHHPLLEAVRDKAAETSGARLISICSGALILAAAGVLDGRPATTHWSREEDTRDYAQVMWDLDRISVSQDNVFTSAGVTTGIDLALAIIRADCGNATALAVARELVVQLRRTGGQSQYAIHLAGQFTRDDNLGRLIEAVIARPDRAWTLDALAQEAGMNSRTLSRQFNRHLKTSPAQFVERVRVDHARGLLSDRMPLKTVASSSGFGDTQRMRRAFQRHFGVGLGDYIRIFGEG